jgi:hypothetical protein
MDHIPGGYGGSWGKPSSDPVNYWPGAVVGVDIEVTDVEQQVGLGPDNIAPFDTLNSLYVYGVKGLDEPYAAQVGRQWLAGVINDAEKDSLVHSTIDSLFMTMRQAKSVYESIQFGDSLGGTRHASSRAEFEAALRAAIDQGKLVLSPPAPATFDVTSGAGRMELSWTLNTTTGSDIAGWRLYRAMSSGKGDSAYTLIADLPPNVLEYDDTNIEVGYSHYYYLTTYDAAGNESTMHTRTISPAVLACKGVCSSLDQSQPASSIVLSQNAPNPFNPATTISFSIPEAASVSLTVHSVTGQLVRTLVDAKLPVGEHAVSWNGTDDAGRAVASGVYLYRLAANDQIMVRRLVVVR